MSVVGRAYVTVRAITRQVEGDIESGLNKALDKVDAGTAGSKIGDSLGQGVGAGVEKSDIGKSLDRAVAAHDPETRGKDIGTALGQAIGDSLLDNGRVGNALARMYDRMHDDADREGPGIGSALGNGIGKGLSRTLLSPSVVLGSVLLPVLQDAGGAIGALTASATALAQTLGPVLAAGAGVGATGILALGTTVGALTLAFKTQTDELDELKASMRPLRDEWRAVGEDIQGTLFPALEGAATRLTTALGPTVRDGLVSTAGAVGGIVRQFTRLGESAEFQQRLGQTFDSNALALRDFGSAGVAAADSMVTIASAAGPVTERFAAWAESMSKAAAARLDLMKDSGALTSFFTRAGDTTALWGNALGNTLNALGNIFSLGSKEGGRLLGSLDAITQRFESWTESALGQQAILEWFTTSGPVVSALGDAVGGIAEGLRSFSGGADEAAASLSSIGRIAPDVGKFLGNFTSSLSTLLGMLEPVAQEIADLGPTVDQVFDSLFAEFGPAVADLAPKLGELADSAIRLVGAFAPTIGILGEVAEVVATVLAPAAEGAAIALEALPDVVPGVIGSLVILRLAFTKLAASTVIGPQITAYKANIAALRATNVAAGASFAGLRAAATATWAALGPFAIALGVASIAIGAFSGRQEEASTDTTEFTATLNAQTGAITKNSEAWIAKKLAEDGVYAAAGRIGVSSDLVTRAALGEKDAYEALEEQVTSVFYAKKAAMEASDGGLSSDELAELRSLQEAYMGIIGPVGDYGSSQRQTAADIRTANIALREHREGMFVTGNSTGRLARQNAEYGGSALDAADNTRSLTRDIYAYHDATVKAIGGSISFEQSIDDAMKEIKEGAKTLRIGTQAGRDNMNALLGVASAAGSVTGSARKQEAALERGRAVIIRLADQMRGISRKEAVALADSLISIKDKAEDIPNDVPIRFNTPGLTESEAAMARLKRTIDGLHDKTINIHVNRTSSGGELDYVSGGPGRAAGGWIEGPGSITSDSIRYGSGRVSNREFVVNAKDAAANAPWLEQVNRGKGPGNAAAAAAPALPRRIALRIGSREFEAYVEEIADGRIDAADSLTWQGS